MSGASISVSALPLRRIAQLVRLLGSDKQGEVTAAVGALGRALNAAGGDFNDFATIIEARLAQNDNRRHRHDDVELELNWRQARFECLTSGYPFSTRERVFLNDIGGLDRLSAKQEAWLAGLYRRSAR